MPQFPYMSQVFNTIPNVFEGLTPLYADAPRRRYEAEQAAEQKAYQREMDAKKMQMAEEEHAAQQQARHLDNAVKLLKLGGTAAATGYLDKFMPGHGITAEGIGGGMYAVRGKKGSGGAGSTAIVVDPNAPADAGIVVIGPDGVPKFRDDVAQKIMSGGYSAKDVTRLKGMLDATRKNIGETKAKPKRKYQNITVIDEDGTPRSITVDEDGQPIRMNLLPPEETTTENKETTGTAPAPLPLPSGITREVPVDRSAIKGRIVPVKARTTVPIVAPPVEVLPPDTPPPAAPWEFGSAIERPKI